MRYVIVIKNRALKDLKGVGKEDARRIVEKIRMLEDDLSGDVKRLTNFTPE